MKVLVGGSVQAAASGRTEDVPSPFDGTVPGTVPVAGPDDVRAALDRAEAGAVTWRRTPAHERMRILLRAAELADERAEQTAQIISAEAGKTITEARGEASRSGDLIRLAAFEGTQLYGDALPLDANRGTGLDKIGFTIHQPVGIVVAITPFNYPALLVVLPAGGRVGRRRERVGGGGLHQRGPGLLVRAGGQPPPGRRRGLPRRGGAKGGGVQDGGPGGGGPGRGHAVHRR